MKKVILFSMFIAVCMSTVNAQENQKALGLRVGLYSGEISYQHPLGAANRLEADLGLTAYGVGVSGIYQWVWNIPSVADGMKLYAGGGLGLGIYSSVFAAGVLGQAGLEYNFKFPLKLSLDFRPGLYLSPAVVVASDGICLAARYRF